MARLQVRVLTLNSRPLKSGMSFCGSSISTSDRLVYAISVPLIAAHNEIRPAAKVSRSTSFA